MLPSFVRVLFLTVALSICAGFHGSAQAQSCHAPSLRALEQQSFRATLGSVYASYANARYTGEYQGAHALVAFAHPRLFIDVSVPYYRLVRNGRTVHGVGDVATDVRVSALEWPEHGVSVGPELSATLPTGSRKRDLGMGHLMLMPGLFMLIVNHDLTVMVQLAYGRALDAGHGHTHAGVQPIVNPMNRSEIEHAIAASFALNPMVRVSSRLMGAVPIADSDGAAREVFAAGAQLVLGPTDLALEQHLPLTGDPFTAKTVLSFSGQW